MGVESAERRMRPITTSIHSYLCYIDLCRFLLPSLFLPMPPKRKAATPKRTPKKGRKAPQARDVHYPGGGLSTSFRGLQPLYSLISNIDATLLH